MNLEERARLRTLAAAATSGSWNVRKPQKHFDYEIGPGLENAAHSWNEHNANFIAAARTAVPALLNALDVAEARASQLEKALRDILSCEALSDLVTTVRRE